jgi:hypothetical protein
MVSHGRTSLSEEQYDASLAKVRTHLQREGRVTNRTLRSLTGLNYDQAIKFFNFAVERGVLIRRGRASGIHYVPSQEVE